MRFVCGERAWFNIRGIQISSNHMQPTSCSRRSIFCITASVAPYNIFGFVFLSHLNHMINDATSALDSIDLIKKKLFFFVTCNCTNANFIY